MKLLIVVVVLATVCSASAVKPRFNSRRFQRLEASPAPPVPHTVYGPPPQNPPQEYGPPPQETTTQAAEATTTTETPTTTEALSESVNTTNSTDGSKPINNKLTRGQQKGVYYIYHPNGQLQKVVFNTKKDSKTMALTAQLRYENVEPINGPIFTYDPQNLILTPYNQ